MRLSIADRVSLAKLQSFSCDTSKKSVDCEKHDKLERSKRKNETKDYDACSQKVARSRCRLENKESCGSKRRKDACASSQDDARENRQQRQKNSKLSKNCYPSICPELKQRLCNWDKEQCPEDRRKYDTNRQISSRDRAQQLKGSNCKKRILIQDIIRVI